MGFSLPRWNKESEGGNSPPSPALTIAVFFGIIYILEKSIPGSFYAVISALLGAGVLCVFQARGPTEPRLVALQRLARLLGFGGDTDDGVDDGQAGRPQSVADSRSSPAAACTISGEQKDGADPCLDENNWPQNGGRGSYTVGDTDSSATQGRQSLDIDDNETDGLLGDGVALMGDWFENLNSQDRAAAEAGAHVAMAEDVEKTDPVDKARLDLLFRYLASMEGGNKDQVSSAPASAQRQKLQRKLLLRTAGLGENNKATKNVVKAESSESAGQEVELGVDKVEDLLEDSVKIEALLRELGEDSSKLNSASLPKAKKAKPMPRRKGAATSAPTRGSSKEELISVCSKATFASPSRPSPDMEKEDAIEVGVGQTESPAQAEMSLEEAAEFEVEAQVVANRKARRKGRKESDVVAPEAPRSRTSSGETMQPPNVVGPKPSAVPAVVQNFSTEVPLELAGQAKAAQPSKAAGIANQGEDPGAEGEQSMAITANTAECVLSPIATVAAAKLNTAAADAMTVAGPSTSSRESPNTASSSALAAHPSKERPKNKESEANAKGELASALPEEMEDEEEEWGEDGEDWEWQCPDGFPLQSHTCETPTLCGSCGEMQPQGSAMQLAVESGWAACEECIHIAFNQPVEATALQQAGMLTVDPSRMTALEIATWFQDRGAENDLRQCMLQIMAAEAESSKVSSTQEVVSPTPI